MWTFKVTAGELWHDGKFISKGYSGAPGYVNDPSKEDLRNRGPLPRGGWRVGETVVVQRLGPVVLRLTPKPATKMFGRSGFLIHADSIKRPGGASEGCLILPYTTRILITASPDKDLEVV